MKILVFVDTHGNKTALERIVKKAEKVDLLISCGDISNWGQDLKKIFSILSKAKKPLLIIPGNHEIDEELKEICSLFDFIIDLHQKSYVLNDHTFFGYGGGGFALTDPKFERITKKFKKTLKKNSKVILITHAPPYNTKVDSLNYLGHRGCKSIRKFIEEVQPIFHFCGHLHENIGKRDKIKKTFVVNPGPEGKIINLN